MMEVQAYWVVLSGLMSQMTSAAAADSSLTGLQPEGVWGVIQPDFYFTL